MPLAEGFPSRCSYSVLTLKAPEETLLPDLVGKGVVEETIYLQNLVCLYPTSSLTCMELLGSCSQLCTGLLLWIS